MGKESREPLLGGSFEYKEQDPDYKGDRVQNQLQNGPAEERPCRDVIFAILFLLLWGAMGYIAYIGFSTGDPTKLASPFDSDGHQCKLSAGYANYPFVFAGVLTIDPSSIVYVCVQKCPTDQNSTLECKTNSKVQNCNDLVAYATSEFVNVCLPSVNSTEYIDQIEKALHLGGLTQGFSDLRNSWQIILACAGYAIVISILFSVFIRYCAGCMVWFIIIALMIVLAGGGTFAYLLRSSTWVQDMVQFQSFPGSLKDTDVLLGTAIACWGLCLIVMLMMCCLYKQIRVTIGIMKAAADFVRQQCSTYFIPFFAIIFQVGFLALWITVILYLFSAGEVTAFGDGTPFAWIVWNEQTRYFIILYLFGLIWYSLYLARVLVFISGLGKFMVSSIVACWYFEEGEPRHPFLKSLCRSIKCFGSIALGSFLITVVITIRVVLQIFQKYAKQSTMPNESRKVVMCCLKYASCLVACFERVIRFITDSAYIMMAITGKGFCASASEAFYLLLRQTSQQFVAHSTIRLFKWFGKLLIAFTTMFIGFIHITNIEYFRTRIFSPLFPMVAFLIVAYPVASSFMEFFAISAKTLLLCYCIQLDLAVSRAKCPPALRNFFEDYVQDSEYYDEDR